MTRREDNLGDGADRSVPDALDRLLDETEPAADLGAVGRLQEAWRLERGRVDRGGVDREREVARRQWWRRAVAVAAVVTVGATAGLVWTGLREPGRRVGPELAERESAGMASNVAGEGLGGAAGHEREELERENQFAARAPNLIERLAVLQAARKPPAPAAREQAPEVEGLMARLRAPLVADRAVAAQALGRMADEATVARLEQMTREPSVRREAVMALMASPSPRARAFLEGAQELMGLWKSLELQARAGEGAVLKPRSAIEGNEIG